MPTDPPPPTPPPVIGYRSAGPVRPVTRAERIFVVIGYGLVIVGAAALLLGFHQNLEPGDPRITAGFVIFALGALITVICFIYNAVRRL